MSMMPSLHLSIITPTSFDRKHRVDKTESTSSQQSETLESKVTSLKKEVALKGNNNKWVSGENGNAPMTFNRNNPAGWERLTVVDAGGGKVALKNTRGLYVSSSNGSPANDNESGAWYITKQAGCTKASSQTGAVTLIQRFGGAVCSLSYTFFGWCFCG